MRYSNLVCALIPFITAAFSLPAEASGTRSFTLDSLERLSGGDLKGTSISSDGIVRAGWAFSNAALPEASSVFAAHLQSDGSLLIGTSPNGKIVRVSNEGAAVYADTGALAVTAFASSASGTVYAATIPDGKIFKVAQGKAELFATLSDMSHIWALAVDKNGALFAAGGPEARVMRVEANGTSSVYFKSDEPYIASLAVGEKGELYAGSSGKGIIYKITGAGRASVLYDFIGEEVKSIAVAKGGVLYAIANEYGELPEIPKRPPTTSRTAAGPSLTPKPKPGKGVLMKFDAEGRPEKMIGNSDSHFLSLAVDAAGRPYVGTGVEGRVYTVDDAHSVTLIADTDERQIGAIALPQNGISGGYVVSGDPAVAHRISGVGGADSSWTSKALDSAIPAKYGTLTWQSTGPIELSTRSGNTQTPDATWSAWSASKRESGKIESPKGRFIQVRAKWPADSKAELSNVVVPYLTDNVRPIVTEVNALQKGTNRDGDPQKHESIVKISWKVENPDNDSLRYRIAFKREGANAWREVTRPEEMLTKTEYEWETLALPEGRYRVRIEASDELSNSPERTEKHTRESDPVVVDNTPPVVQSLSVEGKRLRARITDGVGPIVRVEAALDGRAEWRPLGAADGLFDTADESVDTDLTPMLAASAPGPNALHFVSVRAFDATGNQVTREVDVPR